MPKVTFYTNTRSADVVCGLYRRYYEKGLYKDLWYAPDGKPMIIGVSEDGLISAQNRELYAMLKEDFFDFRESQWPDGKTTIENLETGFPWMSWQYPQKNFNGMMSVSLAQHPDAKMSNGPLTNNGKGFDYKKMRNYTSNSDKGTNYQGQWETVFENNADSSKKYVDQVLVTGFNEWMAIKLNDGNDSYFVDTFSEEYSRDIEMMKGGYGDNFVVQTLINTRKYKYSEAKHYKYDLKTMPLDDFSAEAWKDVKSEYKDPVGDALARDYRDAFSTTTYVDNSNRNDISSVRIAHDTANLYVRVETAEAVTAYNGTDKNWMNLLIQTENGGENSFAGFHPQPFARRQRQNERGKEQGRLFLGNRGLGAIRRFWKRRFIQYSVGISGTDRTELLYPHQGVRQRDQTRRHHGLLCVRRQRAHRQIRLFLRILRGKP